MRKITITALILVAGITAQAQRINPADKMTWINRNGGITDSVGHVLVKHHFPIIESEVIPFIPPTQLTLPSITPAYNIIFTNGELKPVATFKLLKDGQPTGLGDGWDIMLIHIKKSNFRWLNDTTAVYINK